MEIHRGYHGAEEGSLPDGYTSSPMVSISHQPVDSKRYASDDEGEGKLCQGKKIEGVEWDQKQ
jgi:hypothetical protein